MRRPPGRGEGRSAVVATAVVGLWSGGFAGFLVGFALAPWFAAGDDTGLAAGLWPLCGAVAGALVGAPCMLWFGRSRPVRPRRG